jgi:hypothetical protein
MGAGVPSPASGEGRVGAKPSGVWNPCSGRVTGLEHESRYLYDSPTHWPEVLPPTELGTGDSSLR